MPAGIRACFLFFLKVPESRGPEARVSWGPLAEKHTQGDIQVLKKQLALAAQAPDSLQAQGAQRTPWMDVSSSQLQRETLSLPRFKGRFLT